MCRYTAKEKQNLINSIQVYIPPAAENSKRRIFRLRRKKTKTYINLPRADYLINSDVNFFINKKPVQSSPTLNKYNPVFTPYVINSKIESTTITKSPNR